MNTPQMPIRDTHIPDTPRGARPRRSVESGNSRRWERIHHRLPPTCVIKWWQARRRCTLGLLHQLADSHDSFLPRYLYVVL